MIMWTDIKVGLKNWFLLKNTVFDYKMIYLQKILQ